MIAVVGASGYTGGMLLRLLSRHPQVPVQAIAAVSTSQPGASVETVHHDLVGKGLRFCAEVPKQADVIFLCTGHGHAATWMDNNDVGDALVIDLSADHRLNDAWVYGLPEKNRHSIVGSKRIANPGCFATSIELALMPLAKTHQLSQAIVQATTGSSGAGHTPTETTHYTWRANNLSVYKPFTHQHLAEISMVLGATPTLIPMRGAFTRGILASCVLPTTLSTYDVQELYRAAYANEPFAVVADELPDVKCSVSTNNCVVGFVVHENTLLVVSVLDNLLKGASGQAVQNMNIALGWDEHSGLDLIGGAP
ncbi:MAG: N-acetyl-gamma-glutamyl-phosphate reductase [Bradyrhizobiaceae bacterium]|nr:N-acetyl-gamma-glutamyl-phosphate reductase [Bradyrhizobiaceae bacterium]